ncbi:MAG: hypothetical protein QW594_00300 [Candidatus Woesearchaeota archaeon]
MGEVQDDVNPGFSPIQKKPSQKPAVLRKISEQELEHEKKVIKLLLYKDKALVMVVNLLQGAAYLPSVETYPDKKSILTAIKQHYHIILDHYDFFDMRGRCFVFAGEWDGTFSVDDDALRCKWVPISQVKIRDVLTIRKRYRDVVDTLGDTIGVATVEEIEHYQLRIRVLLAGKKQIPFFLGETVDDVLERLKLPPSTLIKSYPDKHKNLYCYEVV